MRKNGRPPSGTAPSGSGGMFVQSAAFVEHHKKNVNEISIYGLKFCQPAVWELLSRRRPQPDRHLSPSPPFPKWEFCSSGHPICSSGGQSRASYLI